MLDGNANIDVINGTVKFMDKNSVEVTSPDGAKSTLTAQTIVINISICNS